MQTATEVINGLEGKIEELNAQLQKAWAKSDKLRAERDDARLKARESVSASPQPEKLAQLFHETYERLAPQFGYETRKESAKAWLDIPPNNRRLMIAVCAEMSQFFAAAPAHTEPDYNRAYTILADALNLNPEFYGLVEMAQVAANRLTGKYAAASAQEPRIGEPCPTCERVYLGKMGPGDYSCCVCGMGMVEPCEHWKLFEEKAAQEQPVENSPQQYFCSTCTQYLTVIEAMDTHNQSHDIVRVIPNSPQRGKP